MDLTTRETIQFTALSVFSENMVTARQRIETMNAQLRDPSTNSTTKAAIHNNLRGSIQTYDSFRMKQAKKKHEVLQSLYAKYPELDQDEIERCLSIAVNEYEMEERRSNLQIYNSIEEITEIRIPVYSAPSPTRKDMAVLLVYFNACSYKKLAQNLCLVYQTLLRAGIPVFLVEHCFKDQVPLFPENGQTIFNTRSDSYMFYKENLQNWLMSKVPAEYTKFFMMDCDLLFEKPSWYNDVSVLLDKYDIVQPFQEGVWLDSDLKTSIAKRTGFVYSNTKGKTLDLSKHHPGFTWAFRRDFIESKGIYDLNIMGSGDVILGYSALQKPFEWNLDMEWSVKYYKDYYESFNGVKTTYYSQTIYHLWHGERIRRLKDNSVRYNGFIKLCKEYNVCKKEDIFEVNASGIYEYILDKRESCNNIILDYFKGRNEDGI
jgi:hypothetical protein